MSWITLQNLQRAFCIKHKAASVLLVPEDDMALGASTGPKEACCTGIFSGKQPVLSSTQLSLCASGLAQGLMSLDPCILACTLQNPGCECSAVQCYWFDGLHRHVSSRNDTAVHTVHIAQSLKGASGTYQWQQGSPSSPQISCPSGTVLSSSHSF